MRTSNDGRRSSGARPPRQPRPKRPATARQLLPGTGLLSRLLLAGWLPRLFTAAVIATVIGYGLANYHRPHNVQQVATGAITRTDIRPDLAAVLADQRKADADHREAWIADGYSHDLQVFADDASSGGATIPGVQAQDYLDAYEASGLQPGWQAAYAQLRAALNEQAAADGLAPVPAPPYPVSAKAPAYRLLPLFAGGGGTAAACTATSTTTNSSSSTGAHSTSVKTTTKCGTASTSVTHKTSVSKTGVVTNTTTTTG